MNFAHPDWLPAVPLAAALLLGLCLYGLRAQTRLLERFAAPRLLDRLVNAGGGARTGFKIGLLVTGTAVLTAALARPQWGVEWVERKARGLDIVFAIDCSRSMLASDMRPNRLERARLAVLDLVDRLEGDRIGLVAFSGQAFLQCPPTLDYAAFREALDASGPGILTSGGSNLGAAVREALNAFPEKDNERIVILLTDGEDLGGEALAAADEAAEQGVTVFTVGAGTAQGEVLSVDNAQGGVDLILDPQGEPVRSRLDEPGLRAIATATGGVYAPLEARALDDLYRRVLAALPRSEREAEIEEVPIERFQWPLGIALLLFAAEPLVRRRGRESAVAVLAAMALAAGPSSLRAQPDEAAAVEAEPAAPAGIDEDPRIAYNYGTELLRAGKTEAADAAFGQALRQGDRDLQRDTFYNMGHSAYQAARAAFEAQDVAAALDALVEAEERFASAAEIDPGDAGAVERADAVREYREALEEIIEQQQEQQQQQQQGDGDSQQQDGESGESEQQDGEQSEDGQENQQSEQQDGQQQDGQQSESSDPNGEQSDEQSGETEQSDDPQGGEPQPEPGEEEGEEGEQTAAGDPSGEEDESGEESQQAQSGEQSGEQAEGEDGQPVVLEGMSVEEAQALLESLQNSERLLPFTETTRSGSPADGARRNW